MENKSIKFNAELADLILSGKKTATWRLFDDKDLQKGDKVIFIRRPELKEFAKAKLTNVIEKPFNELRFEDLEGHEDYPSKESMYSTFEGMYSKKVDGNTLVKVIKFEILKG